MYNTIGFELRLSRIINPYSGRAVIAALDQGLVEGAVRGIAPVGDVVKTISHSSPEAIILTPGSVSATYNTFKGKKRPALILRIDAVNARRKSRPGQDVEIFHTGIISPFEALKIGVDGVICFFYVGHGDFMLEGEMIQHLSECSYRCREIGLPLIAEAAPVNVDDEYDAELIKFAVRVASEAGADLIATNYTGDTDSFREVMEYASVPVLVRGGPEIYTDMDLLTMVNDVFDAGAMGIVLGKDIIQAVNPMKMIRALSAVVHEEKTVDEALEILEE